MKKRIAYISLYFFTVLLIFILQKPLFMLYNGAIEKGFGFTDFLHVTWSLLPNATGSTGRAAHASARTSSTTGTAKIPEAASTRKSRCARQTGNVSWQTIILWVVIRTCIFILSLKWQNDSWKNA